tara:strand:+ start:47 stop:406 length:360 start_codon:yes stop_codon:yes gene_type:complete
MSASSIDFSAYIFECCCGELYNNTRSASVCRKCRNYSVWGYTKYVINIETNEVVHGAIPTNEEYAAAEAIAVKRWADEDREFIEWQQAYESEEEEDIEQEAERLVDQLYLLQDKMMGYV